MLTICVARKRVWAAVLVPNTHLYPIRHLKPPLEHTGCRPIEVMDGSRQRGRLTEVEGEDISSRDCTSFGNM